MFLAQSGWTDLFQEDALGDLRLAPLLLNLALVLFLGQVLSWHYQRFAAVLSNKRKNARLFVLLAATTMLVISVVKVSLALSLGLVGALSIIRFRTPVKEPEELLYLFLSVAVGIGLGADQRIATMVLLAGILVWTAVTAGSGLGASAPRLVVHLRTEFTGDGGAGVLRELVARLAEVTTSVDLRRVDRQGGVLEATLLVDARGQDAAATLLERVEAAFPGGSVSVVEGGSLD